MRATTDVLTLLKASFMVLDIITQKKTYLVAKRSKARRKCTQPECSALHCCHSFCPQGDHCSVQQPSRALLLREHPDLQQCCGVKDITWGSRVYQARPTQFPRAFSMTCQPAGLNSCPSPMSPMQAPVASIYNPLQAQTSERRHSMSSIPSQVRVGPEQLKRTAQVCPKSPVEVEVPGLKVLHVQFSSPLQLYSQSNIMDSLKGQISSVSPDFPSLDQHNQPPGGIVIDRESEVYKMLQEKQESNEPPRQSASFLVLQEILESEEKGDPTKPSGFRSVKAPTTKVASSIGNAQKLPMCEKCGSGIVGVFVKIRDKQRHPECYVCSDCGTNLKQKGHFFVEDQIYCEKHARERVIPPEGYEVVTVFPK
ncbi:PDZ and LIM domain protein 1 isoform X2 [Strigops habroptila]|uniref:PDZ and LIM domain protein 1 isoform X2 n=1 Tax=Strigops habroptila TaxID=2489341 RepID=UPI0011CF6F19|nr:PDZ and LIM domain protein 1 isoform X2 [Strigops habroptila]